MRLAEHLQGRDNNLNLLRVMAAAGVVLSHAFVLTTGVFETEPLRSTFGMSLGDIAVDIFFVISGLLVTGSLARRNDLPAYLIARFRRIYPGLLLMLLIVNIPIGLWLTSLPWSEYLWSPGLRLNFFHNIVMVISASTGLPGVMDAAPWPHAINGSLWTLTYEIRLYLWLAAIWAVSRLFRSRQAIAFTALVVGTWLVAYALFLTADHGRTGNPVPRLVLLFAAGTLLHILRDRVILSWKGVLGALLLLTAAWFQGAAFRPAYALLAPYLILALAYLPRGAIRAYNRAGDYSFGLYIYAFPIQQILVYLRPNDSPLAHTAFALLLTSVPAILSWHLVEKPFLRGR